ncbi:hypothetical protein BaRGS_00014273 [Batillaria attramentaria]|uniref:Uncharacterized protein n=1 Tax=Batillaria attramentaria TaxID=370345 RepID=A0ABD0L4E2_9CAEN
MCLKDEGNKFRSVPALPQYSNRRPVVPIPSSLHVTSFASADHFSALQPILNSSVISVEMMRLGSMPRGMGGGMVGITGKGLKECPRATTAHIRHVNPVNRFIYPGTLPPLLRRHSAFAVMCAIAGPVPEQLMSICRDGSSTNAYGGDIRSRFKNHENLKTE